MLLGTCSEVGVFTLGTMTLELAPEIMRQQCRIRPENVVYMGRLAIRPENLGLNDPLTNLHQYLEIGEAAQVGIKEDIETAIAERLPSTPFVNQVGFEFTGHDFVSVKDKVSMNSMTKTNLDICHKEKELTANPDMARELIRATSESQEVVKLAEWFTDAPVNAYMIFESLPIGAQKFAISRIYQKTSKTQLEGSFLSLYSSSISQFNQLRQTLKPGEAAGNSEEGILDNNFEFYDATLANSTEFINFYTGSYDRLLQTSFSKQYSFGLETDKKTEKINGIEKVRSQPKLTAIYIDTVKALATSQGKVTPELIQINDRLDIGYDLITGQPLTVKTARDILKSVTTSIVSVIDRADGKLLFDLEAAEAGDYASYGAASHYGGQAKSEGANYDSGGCAEYSRADSTNANGESEYNSIAAAFSINKTPDNFGKPKIDVCRIANCPSRGDSSWWPDRTLVGGCSICIQCHVLFEKGKSPEKIYKEKELQKKKEIDEIAKKRAAKIRQQEIAKKKKTA